MRVRNGSPSWRRSSSRWRSSASLRSSVMRPRSCPVTAGCTGNMDEVERQPLRRLRGTGLDRQAQLAELEHEPPLGGLGGRPRDDGGRIGLVRAARVSRHDRHHTSSRPAGSIQLHRHDALRQRQ